MGQTCCNFSSKDPNAMSVNGSSINKMGGATKVQVQELTPQLKEALTFAKQHEKKLVKIQAAVRGYLIRRQLAPKKPSRKSSRKNQSANKGKNEQVGDIGAAILSHRSAGGHGVCKGGGMAGNTSHKGLDFAKALKSLPDYSSFATRETEKQLGPFIYDLDDKKLFGTELLTRGPYELDNGAIYQG